MREKTDSYLGLARRAGRLAVGTETCMAEIKKGRLKLIVISEDTAEGSRDKVISAAERNGVSYRVYGEREKLSHVAGKPGSCVFGVKDESFAKAIREEIDKNRGKEVL